MLMRFAHIFDLQIDFLKPLCRNPVCQSDKYSIADSSCRQDRHLHEQILRLAAIQPNKRRYVGGAFYGNHQYRHRNRRDDKRLSCLVTARIKGCEEYQIENRIQYQTKAIPCDSRVQAHGVVCYAKGAPQM